MPAGFIPNEALGVTLQELLGAVPHTLLPWSLLFWVNDFVPGPTVTLANLVEASWQGYGRLLLSRDLWTVPTVTGGCAHSTFTEDPTVWQVTGGPVQTIYGYAFVETGGTRLRFVQRFDAEDITPIVVGGTVSLLPQYTYTSAECAE